ncbi:MAG: hypothetical protein ACLQVJ_07930 [Syntrophobacteraceae bacterium]
MASRSCRNVIAVLSLCESCALTIRSFNEGILSTKIAVEMTQKLERAAGEARKHLGIELSKKEADKIAQAMRRAELTSPEFHGNLSEQAVYYTSLALGLLDELFEHIQDAHKIQHLERVERALRELCDHFDNNLDGSAIYEQAGRSVSVWLACMQQ